MRNRWKRVWMWIGLGLGGVALGLVLTFAPVDPTSSLGTDYRRQTWDRLEVLKRSGDRVGDARPLRAGFGRALLTPTIGVRATMPEKGAFRRVPLAGYGDRQGSPAIGVRDDLWVKAIAIESGGRTGVVVSLDALIVPREVSEMAWGRMEREWGLPRGQVYLGATHTHCGLGGWGQGIVAEIFAGGYVPGVREWMSGQMMEAVRMALADLKPATVGSGAFEAPEYTRNRLVGDAGRLDARFSLLAFQQESGRRAVVGSYSAHATVLSGRVMEFSGDYPGAWQRSMEGNGVALAMFLAGAVGSHAPKPPEGGEPGVQAMGRALSERTQAVLEKMTWNHRLALEMGGIAVDLPPMQLRVTERIRTREWLARRLLPVGPRTWVNYLRLGDAIWLGTPCDYSGELSMDLVDETLDRGVTPVVTSFNGDYVGYVVPSKYYGMKTYETWTMSFFGPQLPDLLHDLLRDWVSMPGPRQE